MNKITKRERKMLHDFHIHRWSIMHIMNGRGFWDGDNILPVRIGPIIEGLIRRGFCKEARNHSFIYSIHPVHKNIEPFRCKGKSCQDGTIYNSDDFEIGKCPVCEGYGLVLESNEIT